MTRQQARMNVVYWGGALLLVLLAWSVWQMFFAVPGIRPSDGVIEVLGECEAVTVGGVTRILCTGGTEWIGVKSDPQGSSQSGPREPGTVTVVMPWPGGARALPTAPAIDTEEAGEEITVRVSRYWPPLGPPNCWGPGWIDNYCWARTASGKRWEDWIERGAACPRPWLLKVQVYARGQWWSCIDTGGAIVYGEDRVPWVDFMSQTAVAPYGSTMQVRVREWNG